MRDADWSQSGCSQPRAGFALWILVALAGATAFVLTLDRKGSGAPAASHAGKVGGSFELTAPDGLAVTERTLAGKPFAIFFGFTRCPDVCPTSLSLLARLRKQLGPDGIKFNIVFVSVDPGHDKPADVGSYVALFGTPILGLTGTEAQLERAKKAYGVYSAKVPQPDGDYTIDHSATIYLMTARGEFMGKIDFQEAEATALEKLRRLVG